MCLTASAAAAAPLPRFGVGDAAVGTTWARSMPRVGALRWVGGVYLLLLGVSLLILPPAPLSSPVDSELRGAVRALGGLALLWLAVIVPGPRVMLAVLALVAAPQLWFAAEFWRQGMVPGAATLGLLAVALILTALRPVPAPCPAPRADALGLVFGAAQAVQGAAYMLEPRLAGPIPAALGLSSVACGVLLLVSGVAVVLAQLLPRLPAAVYSAVHLVGGAAPLLVWAAVGLRVDTAYLYLGAATLVRGAAIMTLPWLSGRLECFDGRTLGPRLALALGTASLVPLLVVVPLLLDATVGRAGHAEVRRVVFGGTLALLIVTGVAAWWLAARLATPLATLTRSVESVAAGDRTVPLPATATSELNRLGKAVETMAETIAIREAALRESEARFRTMADETPVIIWATDAAGSIEFVNRAYAAFFGASEEEIRGPNWQVLLHPDDADAYLDAFLTALRDGKPFHAEARVRRADGTWRWIESFGGPRFGPSGEPIGMVGSSPDITDRKVNEAERITFLDALAHDVKNPFTAAKGQAQLLRRGLDDPGKLESGLSGLEEGLDRATALIDELLDVAHVRAGRPLRLHRAPIDLTVLIEECAEAARGSDDLAIRVVTESAPTLGEWNESRLKRVLGNLLGNAVKYSPDGGEVVVRLRREDDAKGAGAVLAVSDQGIGIPAADLPHLFDRFRRGGNVGGIEGTGIGLAGVKQIVQQHGGTIAVESVEGAGSTFTVRLPMPALHPDAAT
ncbi:MAG: ATP-binding protein [Thermomicrobiales bacterium]